MSSTWIGLALRKIEKSDCSWWVIAASLEYSWILYDYYWLFWYTDANLPNLRNHFFFQDLYPTDLYNQDLFDKVPAGSQQLEDKSPRVGRNTGDTSGMKRCLMIYLMCVHPSMWTTWRLYLTDLIIYQTRDSVEPRQMRGIFGVSEFCYV